MESIKNILNFENLEIDKKLKYEKVDITVDIGNDDVSFGIVHYISQDKIDEISSIFLKLDLKLLRNTN